jgi:hypothetical protein
LATVGVDGVGQDEQAAKAESSEDELLHFVSLQPQKGGSRIGFVFEQGSAPMLMQSALFR